MKKGEKVYFEYGWQVGIGKIAEVFEKDGRKILKIKMRLWDNIPLFHMDVWFSEKELLRREYKKLSDETPKED